MKRVVVKLGDVYSVPINGSKVRYFQYIGDDLTQLNSEVIAVFSTAYEASENPDLQVVSSGQVDFYAHTVISLGVKMEIWSKVGKASISSEHSPKFRTSEDDGNPQIKISKKWWVWEPNKEMEYVGILSPKYQKHFEGSVFPAPCIVERIETGEYQVVYPGY